MVAASQGYTNEGKKSLKKKLISNVVNFLLKKKKNLSISFIFWSILDFTALKVYNLLYYLKF